MSVIITAPTAGSLKVAKGTTNAYYCNLKTVVVQADPGTNSINILSHGCQIYNVPLASIATIGVSNGPFTLQSATDAIATLIITT